MSHDLEIYQSKCLEKISKSRQGEKKVGTVTFGSFQKDKLNFIKKKQTIIEYD